VAYFVDITKVRGFVLLLSSPTLVELGVAGIFEAIGTNRICAWRHIPSLKSAEVWEVHYLEQISHGISLSYSELESPQEAIRARELLREAGIIDDIGISTFSGDGRELVKCLKPICQRLDAEALLRRATSNSKPNLITSCFQKFRRFVFGIENEGWGLIVLYVPQDKQGIKIRPGSDVPFIFTETHPVL
jgi:hypothetical protein